MTKSSQPHAHSASAALSLVIPTRMHSIINHELSSPHSSASISAHIHTYSTTSALSTVSLGDFSHLSNAFIRSTHMIFAAIGVLDTQHTVHCDIHQQYGSLRSKSISGLYSKCLMLALLMHSFAHAPYRVLCWANEHLTVGKISALEATR